MHDDVQELVFAVARFAAASSSCSLASSQTAVVRMDTPGWVLLTPSLVVLAAVALALNMAPPPDTPDPHVRGRDRAAAAPRSARSSTSRSRACSSPARSRQPPLVAVRPSGDRRLDRRGPACLRGLRESFSGSLFPSAHPGQVAIADLLPAGVRAGAARRPRVGGPRRAQGVRAANVELAALRDVEVERAALEERTRVARELHDGLAQDLWLAKLRMGELRAMRLTCPARSRRRRARRRGGRRRAG